MQSPTFCWLVSFACVRPRLSAVGAVHDSGRRFIFVRSTVTTRSRSCERSRTAGCQPCRRSRRHRDRVPASENRSHEQVNRAADKPSNCRRTRPTITSKSPVRSEYPALTILARFTHLVILPGCDLDVGTQADPIPCNRKVEFVVRDVPIDTAKDPFQWGNGLVNFGRQTRVGCSKTAWVEAAAASPPAPTTVVLASAPSGWQVGR